LGQQLARGYFSGNRDLEMVRHIQQSTNSHSGSHMTKQYQLIYSKYHLESSHDNHEIRHHMDVRLVLLLGHP
jgi:hypothetical protein